MSSNLIAGTVNLFVDGTPYALVGDFEYSPGLVKRETKAGQDTVHGFSEMPVAPYIAGTIRDMGGLSVAALNAMRNVTVNAELANGKLIVGRNMWTVGEQAAKSTEATIDVRWEGRQGAVTEN